MGREAKALAQSSHRVLIGTDTDAQHKSRGIKLGGVAWLSDVPVKRAPGTHGSPSGTDLSFVSTKANFMAGTKSAAQSSGIPVLWCHSLVSNGVTTETSHQHRRSPCSQGTEVRCLHQLRGLRHFSRSADSLLPAAKTTVCPVAAPPGCSITFLLRGTFSPFSQSLSRRESSRGKFPNPSAVALITAPGMAASKLQHCISLSPPAASLGPSPSSCAPGTCQSPCPGTGCSPGSEASPASS